MTVPFGEIWPMALVLVALLTVLSIFALSLVWLERKVLGRMQARVGPTRVGPFGLLQPVADGIKLLFKEDFIPGRSNKLLFFVAPLLVFVPAFMIWLTVPFAHGLVVRSLELGLFFFVAMATLSIVGLVLAGWSAYSKYAILGGFRSAAQLVSYEVPLIMAVVAVVVLAGSVNFVDVVEAQRTVPYAVVQPLGLLILFIAGLAEVGRTPFDIFLAEEEIVGGPFVEYSGAHWSIFFLAEYVNTFLIAALVTLLFLGGWLWPFGDLPTVAAVAVFLGKTYLVTVAIFWVRATFPRFRIDQLMGFSWKVLIELSFVMVVVTAVQMFYGWPVWTLTLMSLALIALPVALHALLREKPAEERAKRYAENAVLVQGKPKPRKAEG